MRLTSATDQGIPGLLARVVVPSAPDVLVVAAWLLVLTNYQPSDNLWCSLRTGEWIFQNFNVPRHNLFTFSAPEHPWVNHQWLSDFILYLFYAWLGPGWLIFLRATAVVTALGGLYRLLRRRGGVMPSFIISATLLGGHLWRMPSEPILFSSVMMVALLTLLEDPDWRKGRALLLIPLLFALWANVHGTFLVGLIMLWAHGLGGRYDRVRGRTGGPESQLAAGVLALPFTLCNPYYGALYALGLEEIWQLLSGAPMRLQLVPWPYVALLAAASLGLWSVVIISGRAVRWRLLLPLLLLTPLTVLVPDLMSFFFIFGGVTLMEHVEQVAERVRHETHSYLRQLGSLREALLRLGEQLSALSRLDRRLRHGQYAALTLAGGVVFFSIPPGESLELGPLSVTGVTLEAMQSDEDWPVGGVAALNRDNPLPGARVMVPQRWGGYLLLSGYPLLLPFLDGREAALPLEVLEDYDRFSSGRAGWEEVLERYEVDYLLWTPGSFQPRALTAVGRWTVLYSDPISVVLGRAPDPEAPRRRTAHRSSLRMDRPEPSLLPVGNDRPQGSSQPESGLFRPNRSGPRAP